MWHSHLNDMEIPETKRFIPKGFEKYKLRGLFSEFYGIGCEDQIFVNHILLLAKQYLYYCRQNKYAPSIRVLNSKINTIFLIETMIRISQTIRWRPTI